MKHNDHGLVIVEHFYDKSTSSDLCIINMFRRALRRIQINYSFDSILYFSLARA